MSTITAVGPISVGTRVERWDKSYKSFEEQVSNFNSIVTSSNLDLAEINKIYGVVKVEVARLTEAAKSAQKREEELQNGGCCVPSTKAIKLLGGLNVLSKIFVIGGGILAIYDHGNPALKLAGAGIFAVAEFVDAFTSIYEARLWVVGDEFSELAKFNREGLEHAKTFEKFLKALKGIKKLELQLRKERLQTSDVPTKQSKERVYIHIPPHPPSIISEDSSSSTASSEPTSFLPPTVSELTTLSSHPTSAHTITSSSPILKHPIVPSLAESRSRVSTPELDARIKACLKNYEKLPPCFQQAEVYQRVATTLIDTLPPTDAIRKELHTLKHPEDMSMIASHPLSVSYLTDSSIIREEEKEKRWVNEQQIDGEEEEMEISLTRFTKSAWQVAAFNHFFEQRFEASSPFRVIKTLEDSESPRQIRFPREGKQKEVSRKQRETEGVEFDLLPV